MELHALRMLVPRFMPQSEEHLMANHAMKWPGLPRKMKMMAKLRISTTEQSIA